MVVLQMKKRISSSTRILNMLKKKDKGKKAETATRSETVK